MMAPRRLQSFAPAVQAVAVALSSVRSTSSVSPLESGAAAMRVTAAKSDGTSRSASIARTASSAVGLTIGLRTHREDARGGDQEVQRQVGLEVVVPCARARGGDGLSVHGGIRGAGGVRGGETGGLVGPGAARRRLGGGGGVGREGGVGVAGQLAGAEGYRFCTARLSQLTLSEPRSQALLDWDAAAQVGQREVGRSVAAVRGAQQREERGVLVDEQQLAVAVRPSNWGEVEGDHPDLGDELPRIRDLTALAGKNPRQGDAEAQCEVRLAVLMRLT